MSALDGEPGVDPALRALIPGSLAVGVFAAWSAVDGGFASTWWLPGGLFLLGVAAVAAVGGAVSRLHVGRLQAVSLAAFAALTCWSFLSLLWAEVKGDAWDGANRTLVYLVVTALFAALPWRERAAMVVLGAYAASVVAVGIVSFAEMAADPDVADFMGGRLANPTGYQNANAALFMMAFWPAVRYDEP